MSVIDFLKKHEKLLQRKDPGKAALASLKDRLEELHSFKPDYQQLASEIYDKLDKEGLITVDAKIKIGDKVVGVGEFGKKKVDGLRGKVVNNVTFSGLYGVEWEEKIPGGHECGGMAKPGYGWNVKIENLRKANEPDAETRKDYEEFLEKILGQIAVEYLDYDDNDFEEGDEVELLVDLGVFAKGTRGFVVEGFSDPVYVKFQGGGQNTFENEIAKVKNSRRYTYGMELDFVEREFKLGDEVEVVDIPGYCYVKNGSKGIIADYRTNGMMVDFYFLNGKKVMKSEKAKYWIENNYLQIIDDGPSPEMKRTDEIVKGTEEEFNLSEYEGKLLEIRNEIIKLIDEEKVSYEEVSNIFTDFVDLELNYDDSDEELEDLLK